MEAPSSINWTSPASTALFAGQQIQWTSQADSHWNAADTVTGVSGQAVSLFSHAGGIQIIAGNGVVSLQAHTDALEILADKAVTIISVNDGIEILARQKVALQAGQSAVTLDGGDINFVCPGTFSVKGALHPFSKGATAPAALSSLPAGLIGEPVNFIELNQHYDDLEPRKNVPYKLTFSDGSVRTGTLDDNGFARIDAVPPGVAKLKLGEDPRKWSSAPKKANAHAGAASSDAAALALMESTGL